MQAEFDRQHIQYFNDKVFDFFAMVYGDTVPSVAFGSGGMTFEKANFDPIAARTYEHYVAHWVSLSAAATNREQILLDWHGSWVDALTQGAAGQLQANRVNDKGNTVQLPVPDIRVRHYFLRADDPDKTAEVQSLVRRLQRMDVAVYRLTAPLVGAGLHAVRPGAAAHRAAVRHVLGADGAGAEALDPGAPERGHLRPVPLLLRRLGVEQPAALQRRRRALRRDPLRPLRSSSNRCAEPPAPPLPAESPVRGRVPAVVEHRGSRVRGLAALPARAGLAPPVYVRRRRRHRSRGARRRRRPPRPERQRRRSRRTRSARSGRRALASWVEDGRPLRRLARRCGGRGTGGHHLGTARRAEVRRRRRAPAGPLTPGEPARERRRAVRVGLLRLRPRHAAVDPAHAAFSFPPTGHEDFFVSGFARGAEELGGTAAVIDEPFGDGRVVLLASDPNYRAWTIGMQKVLRNAILGPTLRRRASRPRRRAAVERDQGGGRAAVARLADPAHRNGRDRCGSRGGAACARRDVLGQGHRQQGAFPDREPRRADRRGTPLRRVLPDELKQAGVEVVALRVP